MLTSLPPLEILTKILTKNHNCKYGDKKCWFLHTLPGNEKRNGNYKNQQYLVRLFDVVEKFADKLTKLESKMNE